MDEHHSISNGLISLGFTNQRINLCFDSSWKVCNVKLWSYAQSNRYRIVSSIYLQTIKVGQPPSQELLANFQDLLKRETNVVYSDMVFFSQFGETDIQDYVPAQNIFTRILLYTAYYYSKTDVRTDAPCSGTFV